MLHPIISVLIRRPELVADHLSSYVDLVQNEARDVGAELAKRAVAGIVAGVCLLVFLVLAGVAAMLWALTEFHWMLLVAPGVFLLVAVAAGLKAMQKLPQAAFRETRSQLSADAQALHALGAQS